MTTYKTPDAVPHGWYKTDSPRSPLNWVPLEAIDRVDAVKAGFVPNRKGKEFAAVRTSGCKGFRGHSSRVYVSIWSR